MNEFRFYSAKAFSTRLKATIQSSGRLGFTEETAKELNLAEMGYIKLGCFEQEPDIMYLIPCESADEDAFKVCKAGAYYYLPTSALFLALDLDFKTKTIMFDITRCQTLDEALNGNVYKLVRREHEKKRNK